MNAKTTVIIAGVAIAVAVAIAASAMASGPSASLGAGNIASVSAGSCNMSNGIHLSGTYPGGYTDNILDEWPFHRGDELRVSVKVQQGEIAWLRFEAHDAIGVASGHSLLSKTDLSNGEYDYKVNVPGDGQWTMSIAPRTETKADFCIVGLDGSEVTTPPENMQGFPRIHSSSLIYK
jgi:hypothetical protein